MIVDYIKGLQNNFNIVKGEKAGGEKKMSRDVSHGYNLEEPSFLPD